MKVDFVSDLHFNHWMTWIPNQLKWQRRTRELTQRLIENGNGEVLVIAGDFGEWNNQASWILEECARKYERVYFTYGNHDLYLLSKSQKNKYIDSMKRLDDLIEKVSHIDNIVPLNKTVDIYKGKVFAGDMMCYLPKTVDDWNFFRQESNDSVYINLYGHTRENGIRKMWKDSQDWYASIEHVKPDVFVSHVPPIHSPFSQYEPNNLYLVDVPYINAKNWIFGHDHYQKQFFLDDVMFHTNAIGYPETYTNYKKRNTIPEAIVDIHKKFGLRTFEI